MTDPSISAMISALLESGADINSRDENGFTRLHIAASNNPAPAMISALLEAGADINSRDEKDATPAASGSLEKSGCCGDFRPA